MPLTDEGFLLDEDFEVYVPPDRVFPLVVGMERIRRGEIEKFGIALHEGWRVDFGNYVNVGGRKEILKTAYAVRIANYTFGDSKAERIWYGDYVLLQRRMLEYLWDVDITARADGLVLMKVGDVFVVSYGLKKVEITDPFERFRISQSIRHRWYYRGWGFWITDKGTSFAGYMVGDVVPLYLFLEVGLWREVSSRR